MITKKYQVVLLLKEAFEENGFPSKGAYFNEQLCSIVDNLCKENKDKMLVKIARAFYSKLEYQAIENIEVDIEVRKPMLSSSVIFAILEEKFEYKTFYYDGSGTAKLLI